MQDEPLTYAVLSGGVGGAKLVLGLQETLRPQQLTVVANTGDDFEHLGLPICPDIDTLIYTLSGVANPETGWGLANESWDLMAAIDALDGDVWFKLGDRDLETHIRRRDDLVAGLSLAETTARQCRHAGVEVAVWPMSNEPVRTVIDTADGPLEFQDYFVRQQARPVARGIRHSGAAAATAPQPVTNALRQASLAAVFISPSNPWLSIDPILSVSDIKTALADTAAPVIGISPIVGGKALKGPTAKLMRESGIEPSALSIAEHYRPVLDGFIIDTQDENLRPRIEALGIRVEVTNTVMTSLASKSRLAQTAVAFANRLQP